MFWLKCLIEERKDKILAYVHHKMSTYHVPKQDLVFVKCAQKQEKHHLNFKYFSHRAKICHDCFTNANLKSNMTDFTKHFSASGMRRYTRIRSTY